MFGQRASSQTVCRPAPRMIPRSSAWRPLGDGARTVIHGDYHLGQVLRTGSGWTVLDFEGEPAKPLAARIAADSPLRDIAGMLRSFNYARHQALAHAIIERPDALASLAEPVALWERATCAAFLDAYRDASQGRGSFGTWDDARELIELFTLEKAFYELAYEVDHRPDWVRVPLAGIRDLLPDSGGQRRAS